MAPSTAPISHTDIVGVIGALQADGVMITAERVYRELRVRQMPCRRSTVQAVVRSWHQQQQEAAAVAPSPVAPAPPPPVSPLLARREACAQHRVDVDSQRRALAQDEQALAHEVSALRNDIREAARLTRQVRQLQQQATSPAFLMQADASATYARVRHELTALVGKAAVERVLVDPHYRPWWLEG